MRNIELTEREKQVLRLGCLPKRIEIAKRLCISEPTVCSHIVSIYNKLDVTTREQAIVKALKKGIIKLEEIEVN